jgi:hypothetical protein
VAAGEGEDDFDTGFLKGFGCELSAVKRHKWDSLLSGATIS